MKEPIIIVCSVVLGVVLGLALLAARKAYIRRKKNHARRAAPRGPRKRPRFEMTKLVIWVCLVNGIAWVWFSYYLAFKDKTQIAEGLSQVAVTEIIGVVLAYCIKSAVENLSKNNRWPDKGRQMENKPGDTDMPDME